MLSHDTSSQETSLEQNRVIIPYKVYLPAKSRFHWKCLEENLVGRGFTKNRRWPLRHLNEAARALGRAATRQRFSCSSQKYRSSHVRGRKGLGGIDRRRRRVDAFRVLSTHFSGTLCTRAHLLFHRGPWP